MFLRGSRIIFIKARSVEIKSGFFSSRLISWLLEVLMVFTYQVAAKLFFKNTTVKVLFF
jgi:hypothetical protein